MNRIVGHDAKITISLFDPLLRGAVDKEGNQAQRIQDIDGWVIADKPVHAGACLPACGCGRTVEARS